MLESDGETEDTEAKIQRLQNKVEQHEKEYPMKSFHTKDTPRKENVMTVMSMIKAQVHVQQTARSSEHTAMK